MPSAAAVCANSPMYSDPPSGLHRPDRERRHREHALQEARARRCGVALTLGTASRWAALGCGLGHPSRRVRTRLCMRGSMRGRRPSRRSNGLLGPFAVRQNGSQQRTYGAPSARLALAIAVILVSRAGTAVAAEVVDGRGRQLVTLRRRGEGRVRAVMGADISGDEIRFLSKVLVSLGQTSGDV